MSLLPGISIAIRKKLLKRTKSFQKDTQKGDVANHDGAGDTSGWPCPFWGLTNSPFECMY